MFSSTTASLYWIYARKYSRFLFSYDAGFYSLSANKKRIVANSLKALAVYLGMPWLYKIFKGRYEVRYNQTNSYAVFADILGSAGSFKDVEAWLGKVRQLGWRYYFPAAFAALTGLRAGEAFSSLQIIESNGLDGYFNRELSALEHFKYPNVFLRRTKNAYISFIGSRIVRELENLENTPSLQAFQLKAKRAGLKLRFQTARRAWASEVRRIVPSELVDLLQGRISASVFARYYYRPNLREFGAKVVEYLAPFEERLLG